MVFAGPFFLFLSGQRRAYPFLPANEGKTVVFATPKDYRSHVVLERPLTQPGRGLKNLWPVVSKSPVTAPLCGQLTRQPLGSALERYS